MEEIPNIPGYQFVKIHPIKKGLSVDTKYYVETPDGHQYLARICDVSRYQKKCREFELIQKVSHVGLPMPQPVSFGFCKDTSKIYTLLTWIDGRDAEKALPKLPHNKQYELGVEAGIILRKLHDNSIIECREDWETRYYSVIEPRLDAYRSEGITFEGSSKILDFLAENKYLLSTRPQALQHGDYHTGNMIIGNDGHLSIIDWDTADFQNFGDPWYEFNRIGTGLPAFATGQINGYFGNNIPDKFWRLLAFYLAGSAITSIVWAKHFAPKRLQQILLLNANILEWYDGMTNPVPTWYTKTEGAFPWTKL